MDAIVEKFEYDGNLLEPRNSTGNGPTSEKRPVRQREAAVAGALGWVYRDAIAGVTLAVALVVGVAIALALASSWSD